MNTIIRQTITGIATAENFPTGREVIIQTDADLQLEFWNPSAGEFADPLSVSAPQAVVICPSAKVRITTATTANVNVALSNAVNADAVKTVSQALTQAEKQTARSNIGLDIVHTADSYGASPDATASVNVSAFQSALDAIDSAGGGRLLVGPGVYDVNATIFYGDDTTIELLPGASFRKTGSPFGEVLCNKGALTRTVNSNCTLRNICIDANNNDLPSAHVPGLRGQVSAYHVEDFEIDGAYFENSADGFQYAVHVSNFDRVKLDSIRCAGYDKDLIHLGPGDTITTVDCGGPTKDDTHGIQPADYPGSNPETGDISNVTIIRPRRRARDGASGFLLRSVPGAWTSWGLGELYLVGRRCVHSGRVYVCTAPSAATAAVNAPTHSSGSVTGADDGITWRFDHAGTDTSACLRNVKIIDPVNETAAAMINVAGEDSGSNYQITPGQELSAFVDDIRIEFGNHVPSASANFIDGRGYIKRITVSGCVFSSNLSYLYGGNSATGYSNSTDPRGAHTTLMTFEKCHFDGAAASIVALRQNLTVLATFDQCTGSALVSKGGSTGAVTLGECNLSLDPVNTPSVTDGESYSVQDISMLGAWANGAVYVAGARKSDNGSAWQCILGHTAATATNRPGSGTSWQTYWVALPAAAKTYRGGLYHPRTPWSGYRTAIVAMEGLAAGTTSNGGTTAVTTVLDANSGSTANGAALVYQNILPFSRGAGEVDFSKPYAVEFTVKVVASTTNGVSRVIFGKISTTAGDSTVPCVGVEIRDNAIYSHHRNGSSLNQTNLGKSAVDGNWTKVAIHSDGSGNVLYYVDGEFACALTGGPTAVTASNALLVAETTNGGDSSGQRIQVSNPRISVP